MEIDVFDLAKKVPIETVISHYMPLKYRGNRAYGLCPFHNDKHIGSFVVSGNIGKFKCYACGAMGDAIDFVSQICGVGSVEAAITICDTEALISHSDATDLLDRCARTVRCWIEPQKSFEKPELILAERSDAEHLNRVYRCFVKAAGPLPETMKAILRNERHLADSEMQDFFPFPLRKEQSSFWRKFRTELSSEFDIDASDPKIQRDLLLGVPGFFVDGNHRLKFSTSKTPSMGIVIHSRDRKISGLQLRRTGEMHDKQSRYILFSSGFADGTGKYPASYGCNSGYIEDVLYPQVKWNGTIALTEGRFKAITLSKMGCLVVNMHSISNWSPAGSVAIELTKRFPKARRFLLAYDSEHNPAVFKSAESLYEKLKSVRPVFFATWDPMYGKGIDDVVNAGNASHLKSVEPDEFFKLAA